MTSMFLFNRDESIIRTTSTGYIDDNENYVSGATTLVPIKCNIQPYRDGRNSLQTPTGIRILDIIEVYSTTALIAANDKTGIVGDQIVYNGETYFCKDLEVWNPQTYNSKSLIPNHWLGYFYRKDKV